MGAAMSGLVADARTLIEHCRVEAQNHWFTYDSKLRVKSTAQSVCDLALGFGEGKQKMSRPFGVALLIAGHDEDGHQLYHTDPSGTFTRFRAKAIGGGAEGAQSSLNEQYNRTLSLEEIKQLSLQILKQVMEDKISSVNVELGYIGDDGVYTLASTEELEAIIGKLDDGPL